jgi:hypothetical protein
MMTNTQVASEKKIINSPLTIGGGNLLANGKDSCPDDILKKVYDQAQRRTIVSGAIHNALTDIFNAHLAGDTEKVRTIVDKLRGNPRLGIRGLVPDLDQQAYKAGEMSGDFDEALREKCKQQQATAEEKPDSTKAIITQSKALSNTFTQAYTAFMFVLQSSKSKLSPKQQGLLFAGLIGAAAKRNNYQYTIFRKGSSAAVYEKAGREIKNFDVIGLLAGAQRNKPSHNPLQNRGERRVPSWVAPAAGVAGGTAGTILFGEKILEILILLFPILAQKEKSNPGHTTAAATPTKKIGMVV